VPNLGDHPPVDYLTLVRRPNQGQRNARRGHPEQSCDRIAAQHDHRVVDLLHRRGRRTREADGRPKNLEPGNAGAVFAADVLVLVFLIVLNLTDSGRA
jgi:hypothetical protein